MAFHFLHVNIGYYILSGALILGMKFEFHMALPSHELIYYYQGNINQIEVTCFNGQRLWINARHFRQFVSIEGIYGRFQLTTNEQGSFVSLIKF